MAELGLTINALLGTAFTVPKVKHLRVSKHPSETALLSHTPIQGILRVSINATGGNPQADHWVYQAMNKLLALSQRKPSLTSFAKRPVGRILRDFYTCCRGLDTDEALEFLKELRQNGNLDPLNLFFLELQALDAGNRWKEVLCHHNLVDYLPSHVPLDVRKVLLRAMDGLYLNAFIDETDLSETTPSEVAQEYCQNLRVLFEAPPNLGDHPSSLRLWQTWAIGAAALGKRDFASILPASVDPAWVARIHTWSGLGAEVEPVTTVTPQPAEELLGVLSLMTQGPVLDAEEISALVAALPPASLTLLGQWQSQLGALQAQHRERQAGQGSWTSWLDALAIPGANYQALEKQFEEEHTHWPAAGFDEGKVQAWVVATTEDRDGLLKRNILPRLLNWLDDHELTCCGSFWGAWLELLCADDLRLSSDLRLASQLCERFLEQPHTGDQYRLILEALDMIWTKCRSLAALPHALELFETLLDHPVGDRPLLQKGWSNVQTEALSDWQRLDIVRRTLVRDLAQAIMEGSQTLAFPVDEPDLLSEETLPDLRGRTLALYTLLDSVALRCKQMLEERYPGLKVILNRDEVATDGLCALADKADYFLFSARRATHQAFYPIIERLRRRGLNPIYPAGTGTASLVAAFEKEIRSGATRAA